MADCLTPPPVVSTPGLAVMQRLKTRPQFQATLSGGTIARTAHFALHRLMLNEPNVALGAIQTESGAKLSKPAPRALFAVYGSDMPQVWVGSLTPKRWAKRSVTRHCIQRQIYAVLAQFHGQLRNLAPAAYVVRLRSEFDRKQFVSATSQPLKHAVRTELLQLMRYATRNASPNSASKSERAHSQRS